MPFLAAVAVYVGSQACRPCHAEIAAAYAKTPMARSAGRAEPLEAAEFTASGHRYAVDGKRLRFDGGESTIDYYIGSNAAGRTWLRAFEGYLFELPITWYANKRKWDASPGYEGEPYPRLNRAIEPSCLQCHTSRVRPVRGTQNRYGEPPFLEDGVACERCHGPGSEHVREPETARMVNPAKLEAERREAVCQQCHLTGEARIERPGKRFVEFQAGERLADYATYLVWKGPRKALKVTSHVEKLSTSACRTAAGGMLSCLTCHEPHTNTDQSQAACLSCHQQPHHREERCVSCHMPKQQSTDASHGVLTDHSIPRVPQKSQAPERTELVSFLGTVDDRTLGLGYAEIGDARAKEYLGRARPADAAVRLRLAVLETEPVKAAAHYEAVLREQPGETSALVNLGILYATGGQLEAAAKLWQRALEANPAIEEAVLNLSQIQPAAEAERTVRRYLQLNPASPAARARLAALTARKQ